MGELKNKPSHRGDGAQMDNEGQSLEERSSADDDGLPGIALDEPLEILTPAEYAFAEHWLKTRNQIKAYQHAYPGTGQLKAKKLAPALIRQPRIQREIRRIYERFEQYSALELARIEKEIARIGLADFRRAFHPVTGLLLAPNEIDPDTAAAVSSYTEVEDTRTKKITRRVRFFDKGQSLRTLLEMRGALQDPNKGKPAEAPKAVFHFHIAGQTRSVTGAVTVTSPETIDAEPGQVIHSPRPKALKAPGPGAALPRAAKRAKLQRGAAMVRQAAAKALEDAQRPPAHRAKAPRKAASPASSPAERAEPPQSVGISSDQAENGGNGRGGLFTVENSS